MHVYGRVHCCVHVYVYMARTQPVYTAVTGLCTGRVYGRIHGRIYVPYTAVYIDRVQVYTARVYGRKRPCAHVHVYTARTRPVYTAPVDVYTASVHGRVHVYTARMAV